MTHGPVFTLKFEASPGVVATVGREMLTRWRTEMSHIHPIHLIAFGMFCGFLALLNNQHGRLVHDLFSAVLFFGAAVALILGAVWMIVTRR